MHVPATINIPTSVEIWNMCAELEGKKKSPKSKHQVSKTGLLLDAAEYTRMRVELRNIASTTQKLEAWLNTMFGKWRR